MNIEIKEDGCGSQMELAKNVGTHMEESDYQKLAEMCGTRCMSDLEAKMFICSTLGFDPLRVTIIGMVKGRYRYDSCYKVRDIYYRDPQYYSPAWNYLRFDVCGWQYEYVNGNLVFYES